MSSEITAIERHWRARAGGLAWRVNLGWWWHRLAPGLVGVNLAGAGALLLFRQLRWPLEIWAAVLGAAWFVAAAWAWWRARARFYAVGEGLLRLETHLGWHNRLSTAAAGGAPWPEPPEETVRALRWRFGPSAGPLAASAAFLFLGMMVPVGAPPKKPLPPPAQLPAAVQQVQSWTETLKEQNLVEKAMLETWQERLDQLKKKPSQDWYGQESLEAADSLRSQMSQELETLGKNLQKASGLLASLEKLPSSAPLPAELDAELNQMLANLQNGQLPLNADLAMALNAARQLSPEQLEQLKDQLMNGAGVLGAMLGKAGRGMPNQQFSFWKKRQGMPGGEGGGGPADLNYSAQNTDLQASKQEGVSNANMKAPVVGEILAVTAGGAPKPPEPEDASAGGGGADAGNGGDAVWRQELTPQERAVLQRYFK